MRSSHTITATEMRGINRSAVLEAIRCHGPIARTSIAEMLQVSLPTVMRIVDELIAEDLIKPTGKTEWSGGRRRPLLEFNAEGHLVIGVDMTESYLYGAVTDLAGNILTETEMQHNLRGAACYDPLVAFIDRLLQYARTSGKKIRGIGMSVQGITYYEEGIVHWAPTLEWRDFPLKDKLQQHFQLPVILDEDVNLSVLGEMWFGVGQNCRNLVLVIVGKGIGAGIIVDGAIYRGSHLFAGEIGYLLPDRSHLGVRLKGTGALEMLASCENIVARARKALQNHLPVERLEMLTPGDLFNAYQRGEEWATPFIEDMIDYLSQAIVALTVCFDPDMIILSGDVLCVADLMIDPILQRINGTIPILPRLVASRLGRRAVVMGAIMETLYNMTDFYVVHRLS